MLITAELEWPLLHSVAGMHMDVSYACQSIYMKCMYVSAEAMQVGSAYPHPSCVMLKVHTC